MAIIWVSKSGRFINYDSNNLSLPSDAEYITIKDLPDEKIQEIKKSTFAEVQEILSLYI